MNSLTDGRAAFEKGAWSEAYRLLAAADADTPLEPEDLNRLARAAYLTGHDEANADALGENKDKEDRRKKTEQGKSTLGYTRVAPPAAFEPSRSAAPPPVPEARRQLLLNYFIRKK